MLYADGNKRTRLNTHTTWLRTVPQTEAWTAALTALSLAAARPMAPAAMWAASRPTALLSPGATATPTATQVTTLAAAELEARLLLQFQGLRPQTGTRAALEDAKTRATVSAAHAAAAATKTAYSPASTPPTAPALIVTSGTMVTTADTTDTADIKVMTDTTVNTDIIYLLDSQMAGVVTGSTEKHGRDTTDGLFAPVMMDAIVLALEDASPFLLCSPDHN